MLRTRSVRRLCVPDGLAAPKTRLICLPHSGGAAYAYAPWAAYDLAGVELLAVQYPGRGDRLGEAASYTVQELAAQVAQELRDAEPAPVALFGHSLGGLVAYELARALAADGRPAAALMVSSCHPPQHESDGRTHLLPDAQLWSSICALGGVDPSIAQDEDFAQAMVPALRADITAHECYRPDPFAAALECPVRCYHGRRDPLIDRAALAGWAEVTTGPFTLVDRESGHFHAVQNPAGLVRDILEFVAAASPKPDPGTDPNHRRGADHG